MKTHGTIRAVVAIVALLAGGTVARADTNPVYATRIAAVANNSFLVKADGTAWACGDNTYGQIGDGTSGTNRFVAVQVSGLSGVTNISAGTVHAVALKSDGNLWAWGANNQGQLGFSPDGNRHPIPVQVSGISDVKTIAVGFQYNLALKSNGSLWHWGLYNSAPHSTPADTGIAGVSQVACSENTKFVVKGDGTAWGWGYNYYGMIGNNTTADQATPVQVLGGVSNIAAGMYHTVALKSDGTVWAWGYNTYGQIGDGTSGTNRLVPVQVSGLTGVVAIAAGGEHTVALKGDGTVWAWGRNWNGQLGIGVIDYNPHRTPVQVAGGLTGVVAIAAGTEHTVALNGDGTVWVWGYNNAGQLGDGTVSSRPTPVQMVGIANTAPIAYHLRTYCLPNASVTNAPSYYDPDLFGTWTAEVVTNATHGTVVGGANLVYTPTPGFTGIDSFTYKVSDGKTNSNFATGYVNVRANGNPAGMLVDIVVNDLLYPALSNEVQRLKADLTNEGYTAIITTVAPGTSAGAVWTNLNSVYQTTNNWLVGALFIGDVAKIVYDGTYSDGYYWNMHQFQTSAGAVGSHDIWVGRFTISGSALGAEADLIRYALDANHYYRTGQSRLPNTAYVHVGDDWGAGNPMDGDAQAATEVNRAKQVWTNAFVDSNADGTLNGVNGSDLICELSHGNHNLYTAGMTRESAHTGLVQSRAMLCTSCGSGYPDGVVNHQLFSRGGGNLISVGASIECNPSSYTIFRDDNAHMPAGQQAAFRSLLAAGEIWGQAMLKRFPFPEYASHSGASCTMIYGDLSIRPLATPTNAMPSVVSFTKDCATVYVGQPVTFSVAVSDPDGTGEKSTNVLYRYQVEWFMNGYNYGINAPTYTTNDYQNAGWTNVTHTFPAAGTYTIRAEVMDEWRARSYQEMTVTVQPPLVTCAVTAPTNGAVVMEGTNLTITVDATVSYGSVSNVEFSLDGLTIATDLSAPFSCVWTNAVVGAHVLTARATDGAGNVGNATAVNLSVLPITTCTIIAPANGTALLAGTDLTITATAVVLTGTVSKVEFFHDGVKIGEDLSAPYACVWSNVPIGYYALTARATQSDGRTGDAAAVTVNATASGSWEGVLATGGTVTNYTLGGTNWTAHIFTNTSGETFTPLNGSLNVEYLVVAGGGSGGRVNNSGNQAGGGGAGGLLANSLSSLLTISSAQTITVGAGGAGRTTDGATGAKGGSSSIGSLVVATGGGGGTSYGGTTTDKNGGSGGGASNWGGGKGTGIAGPPRQGYDGGNDDGANGNGAGGGGAGGPGGDASASGGGTGGNGGPGVTNSITGIATAYAGGGGAPGATTQGAGGSGIGGNGMRTGSGTTINGRDGTGSGGGGVGDGTSGKGGDGIVIVRYVVGGGGAVALAAPTGFTATTVATNQINLAWADNATNETGYVVDRSTDSNAWVSVTVTSANTTNVSDSGRATNTLYYYRVAASNAAGLSAYCYATGRTWTVYESWQRLNFDLAGLTNLAVSGATSDPDHDGLNNEQEYWAGTCPTNAASCLVLDALTNNPALPGAYVVRWQSATGRLYTVQAATNLVVGFTNLVTHLPATPPLNVHTDSVGSAGQRFYRVQVE